MFDFTNVRLCCGRELGQPASVHGGTTDGAGCAIERCFERETFVAYVNVEQYPL